MVLLLTTGIICAVMTGAFTDKEMILSLAQPAWVTPEFDLWAMMNLSIPLYVITMLSQNLPGIVMIRSYQYETPVKPLLIGTGLANLIAAPLVGLVSTSLQFQRPSV
jgi:benzoate membrane transport protein